MYNTILTRFHVNNSAPTSLIIDDNFMCIIYTVGFMHVYIVQYSGLERETFRRALSNEPPMFTFSRAAGIVFVLSYVIIICHDDSQYLL